MNITLSMGEFLTGAGGLMALLLSLAFLTRPAKISRAALWLTAFCLANGIVIILKVLDSSGVLQSLPQLLTLKFPVGLSRPAFFFLFILYLYKDHQTIQPCHLLHFLPVLVVAVYLLPALLTGTATGQSRFYPLFPDAYYYFINLYSLIYVVLSLKIFLQNRHLTQPGVNNLIYTAFAITAAFLGLSVLNVTFSYAAWIRDLMYQLLSLGFIGISVVLLGAAVPLRIRPAEKYKNSGLDEDLRKKILKKAETLLSRERLYKNPYLKLLQLAEITGVPAHMLSQAINQQTGSSFYDFVNRFRVAEAARMMEDDRCRDWTIEAVGYEAGFNSRSAFYSAFKKLKKHTPASFKKQTA